MTAATTLREEALAGIATLRTRYPQHFSVAWKSRLPAILIPLLLVAVAGYSFVALDFSLARLWAGANRLGFFIVLMFPPDPGPRLWPMLEAMGETLAIAFLGTLVAAVLAFPFALLAAKNIIPNISCTSARGASSTSSRSIDVLIWALMWISVVGPRSLRRGAGGDLVRLRLVRETIFRGDSRRRDRKAAEGVAASGGSRLHQVRFGLLPAGIPRLSPAKCSITSSRTRATPRS